MADSEKVRLLRKMIFDFNFTHDGIDVTAGEWEVLVDAINTVLEFNGEKTDA